MARRNLSEVLSTRYPCPVSWDQMSGDESHRFCRQCRRQVFDFAQMEPRAVKARLEASRGQLCARLTWQGGRLKMLAPPAAEPHQPRPAERAPALAAGIFGAWLTLAAPVGASPAADRPALAATLGGDADGLGQKATTADPETSAPQKYSEEIVVDASTYAFEQTTLGISVSWTAQSLREAFEESDLVFIGEVEASEVLAVSDDIAEVHTTLRLGRRFKGEGWDRSVTYRHSVPIEAFDPELGETPPELVPGSLVLAFLSHSPAESSLAGRPIYEATNWADDLRGLALEEAAAYADRLDDLADLRRAAGPEGELDPAGLMEWLVATAENPHTRGERTSEEILAALDDFATGAGDPAGGETAAASLGAYFTEEQKVRLAAALLATPTMRYGDLDLYLLVRQLDPETAQRWLIETLPGGEVQHVDGVLGWLEEFAEQLDEAEAKRFLAAATERFQAFDELLTEDATPAVEEAWQQQRRELARELFNELAALLDP